MIQLVYVLALLILSGTSGFYIGNYIPATDPHLEDNQWGYYVDECTERVEVFKYNTFSKETKRTTKINYCNI